LVLALHDLAVLGLSNSFVRQCASNVLLDFHNEHISDKHLDIGVGAGHFLDRCRFPSTMPKIALFDLSPHSLAKSAKLRAIKKSVDDDRCAGRKRPIAAVSRAAG
jgi:hypothetical protein